MRIGHGYDAHRFCDDKKMVLGATEIDCEYGFLAHSDGDVLLHAVSDAIFGAAGMRDIGFHYPDTSADFKDADSGVLAADCVKKVRDAGFEIDYIDSTIVAQQPKMAPYIASMRETVAKYAGIPVERYNVKATTEEKMGFTGRLEGISAHAVCILKEN